MSAEVVAMSTKMTSATTSTFGGYLRPAFCGLAGFATFFGGALAVARAAFSFDHPPVFEGRARAETASVPRATMATSERITFLRSEPVCNHQSRPPRARRKRAWQDASD